jgi:hypothetical protein
MKNLPTLNLASAIKNIFNTVLILSVIFAYGIGSIAVIEVEHDHEVNHEVAKSDHDHGHDHHHDNGDHNDSDNSDENNENSHSHKHSHFITFEMPPVFDNTNSHNTDLVSCVIERLTPECMLRPEGPYYALSKPPQKA